jgi:hypothetical protein
VTSLRDFECFVRVLEASGQIVLPEPWFSNFGKRIMRTPKVYFRDSGLLCFLLGLDDPSLPGSPFLGSVRESFIFAEMRKIVASLGDSTRFLFYRDQGGREIDFVLEKAGQLSFVEAKWSEHPGDDRGIGRRVARQAPTLHGIAFLATASSAARAKDLDVALP